MNNPWTLPDARATASHRVALGGLRAFVERNQLMAEESASDTSRHSSTELIRGLQLLLAKKSSVLALTRELEALERQVASAGCLLPQQLRLRVDGTAALRAQLQELLTLKPALLHALRRSAESEAIDVEMQHQRSFIALFLKIGDELPRRAHALATLGDLALVAADLATHQRDFERVTVDLAATIADYQALCDDVTKLRGVYSRLQSETARVQPQLGDSTPTPR